MTTFERRPMDIWESIVFSLRTMLGVPSTFKPRGAVFRILYIGALFLQVLIFTLYTAYFIAFVTRRIYGRQLSTIEEVIRLDYSVFADAVTMNRLKELGMVERFAIVKECSNLDVCFDRLEYEQNMAVVASRQFFEMSNHSNIHCFDRTQSLFTYSTVFMLKPELPVAREFDDVLNRLIGSGLIQEWVKDRAARKVPIEDFVPIQSLQ